MPRLFYPLAALILAAGAFALYWTWQGRVKQMGVAATGPSVSPSGIAPTTSPSILGPGDRPWFKEYDANQRLVSEFRAAHYEPQADGSFQVTRPEVIFHMPQGRRVHLSGGHGVVYGDEAAPVKGASGITTPMQRPTHGQLFDVTIRFASDNPAESPLTLTLNNAVFNTQLLHVFTDAFEDPKTHVKIPGDRSPVLVRGDDFDLDGQGLQLTWNDRDRRLQLLELQHGGRAVLKRVAKLADPIATNPAQDAPGAAPRNTGIPPVPQPEAETTTIPKIEKPTTSPASRPAPGPVQYRATFNDDVRVTQAEQTLVEAALLLVDYATAQSSGSKDKAPASTGPAAPATVPATAPASAKTPEKQAEPVVLTWTGKLRIVPLDKEPMLPIAPGEAAVRFTGSPVVASINGSQARAAALTYQSGRKQAILSASPQLPIVTIKDSRGGTIQGESIEFTDTWVTVSGKSSAEFPDQSNQMLSVKWNKTGRFHLYRGKQTDIDSAQLRGEVTVNHPQIDLSAQELDLSLNPADSEKLPVKHLSARGDVSARLLDSQKKEQTVQAQVLDLDLASDEQGKPFARSFSADGRVHAGNDATRIVADHIKGAMTHGATTQPLADIASFEAGGSVKVISNGAVAAADHLAIRDAGARQTIELLGQPVATVIDADGNTLRGPIIEVFPNVQKGRVPGAGSLRVFQAQGGKKIPIDVTWTGGLSFDLKENQIVIDEKVSADLVDELGRKRKVRCGQMTLLLVDPPGADPSKSNKKQDEFSGIGNKQVQQIILQQQAELESTEPAMAGKPAQTVNVWADKMRFDPATKQFFVPGPGRMLVDASDQGKTAIEWKDHLNVDDAKHQAEMTGEVVVVHQGPNDKGPARLQCPQITAELESSEANGGADGNITVKKLRAQGPVHFSSPQTQFEASEVEYNPETKRLIARGSERSPAQLLDANGVSTGTFEELIYNVATQQVESTRGGKASIRR